jgi:hypothetical protein
MSHLRYFYFSFLWTFIGIGLVGYFTWNATGNWPATLNAVFITVILSVLEISLSFDNAIINAATLKNMTEIWRRRFLTWGILIAVFGMRLVFPVLIVSAAASMGPWEALMLAINDSNRYAEIMLDHHVVISAFGGGFLLMVCFSYFFDSDKEIHWVRLLESRLTALGRLKSIELAAALLVLFLFSIGIHGDARLDFLIAGILGLLTFVAVDTLGTVLEMSAEKVKDVQRASLGMFLYLEVLDASFSFDGVVGAFAISKNILIIMAGLGIGALYVRSLTILLVDKGTLAAYRFLEHGAFYAIGALAATMLIGTFLHIPEYITGLLGAAFIGLSVISSVLYRKKYGQGQPE